MAETTYELQTLLAKPFISGVTYTPGATTTYTPAFPSMGFQAVDLVYYVETSATGTNPTMTLTLMACDDQGTHEYAIGSATSAFHTAADTAVLQNVSVRSQYLCLKVIVANSDNVFPGLTVQVYGITPAPAE